MSDELPNFKGEKYISLIRVDNGWLLRRGTGGSLIDPDKTTLVFESTQSLVAQLREIIGESGWKISSITPVRDSKGQFTKRNQTQPTAQ